MSSKLIIPFVLITVFIITALLSFMVIGEIIAPEEPKVESQSSSTGGLVTINIVDPNQQKEVVNSESDIK